MKEKGSKQPPLKRDMKSLESAVKTLNATQHNPIEWAPIIKFVAPIIARIAVRYVLTAIAKKLNRKISAETRDKLANETADRLSELAIKRVGTVKKSK